MTTPNPRPVTVTTRTTTRQARNTPPAPPKPPRGIHAVTTSQEPSADWPEDTDWPPVNLPPNTGFTVRDQLEPEEPAELTVSRDLHNVQYNDYDTPGDE